MVETRTERELKWSKQLEDVIAKQGEQCRGYAWIHQKAEAMYSRYENLISIPVIVLSTITGFLSASTGSILPTTPETSIALGGISVFVGILNTLGSKFGWAKRAEGHRVAYLSYGELFKFINIEMKLRRRERMNPDDLIKTIRESMKRLAATSPPLPPRILRRFKNEFQVKEKNISQPAETNGLSKIIVTTEDDTQVEENSTQDEIYDEQNTITDKPNVGCVPSILIGEQVTTSSNAVPITFGKNISQKKQNGITATAVKKAAAQ